MVTRYWRPTWLVAVLVLLAPAVLPAQEILVFDFATGTVGNRTGIAGTGVLRRGTTSTVRVVKNFIDLVPNELINVSGGGSISGSITHSRTTGGMGFIEMKIAVPSSQNPGSTITLNVGTSDHFPFKVVRKGLIGERTFSSNPTTLNGGTPFNLTVTGEDLSSDAQLSAVTCHTAAPIGPRNETGFATTLTKTTNTTNCTVGNIGPFSFAVTSSGTNDPSVYATSTGTKTFTFGPYIAPPPSGVVCTSVPGIGAPNVVTPANGQRIVFGAGASATQAITMRWNRRTQSTNSLAPNNEWIVTLPDQTARSSTSITTVIQPGTTTTVSDTSLTTNFRVPGSYTVRIRARNCGADAPTTTFSFQLGF